SIAGQFLRPTRWALITGRSLQCDESSHTGLSICSITDIFDCSSGAKNRATTWWSPSRATNSTRAKARSRTSPTKNASTCSRQSVTLISSFPKTTGSRRRPTSTSTTSTPSSWAMTGKGNSTSSRTSAKLSTCLVLPRYRQLACKPNSVSPDWTSVRFALSWMETSHRQERNGRARKVCGEPPDVVGASGQGTADRGPQSKERRALVGSALSAPYLDLFHGAARPHEDQRERRHRPDDCGRLVHRRQPAHSWDLGSGARSFLLPSADVHRLLRWCGCAVERNQRGKRSLPRQGRSLHHRRPGRSSTGSKGRGGVEQPDR